METLFDIMKCGKKKVIVVKNPKSILKAQALALLFDVLDFETAEEYLNEMTEKEIENWVLTNRRNCDTIKEEAEV